MKVLKTVWNYTVVIAVLLFATGIDSIVEILFNVLGI